MKSTGNHGGAAAGAVSRWSAGAQTKEQQGVAVQEFPPKGVDVSSEKLLHAVRRIDWRFLLPNPALERVAYFGPARSTLLASLQLFAARLTVFPMGADAAQQAHYDVVVACKPTPHQLQEAAALVRPGGSLYVEAHGLLWPARWLHPASVLSLLQQPRLWQPDDYVRVLQEWGIDEAQAFWFWPNVENCTKIIPLADQPVFSYAFGSPTRPQKVKARLKAACKQWLVQSGWLTLLLPSFGIVATKSVDDHQEQSSVV